MSEQAAPEAESADTPPAGWTVARLGDAVTFLRTGPFGSALHQSDYVRGGVPLINPANIGDRTLVPDPTKTVAAGTLGRLAPWVMRPGDVVVGRRGEMGRAAVVPSTLPSWLCGTGCAFIRAGNNLDPTFLSLWFRSAGVRSRLEADAVGATMNNLSSRILSDLPVAFPPIAEQRLIVEKVEALLAQSNGALDRLTRVREVLKRFRQSVLAAACSGRLTEDWRAAHRDAPNNGGNQPDVTADGLPPAFTHRPEEDLPEGWRFLSLGSLGEWRSGATPGKGKAQYWSNGTLPWVSPKDMKSSLIGSSQDLVTEAAVRETRLPAVPAGTLLFVVRGMILAHTFPVGLTTRPVTFNQDIRALTPSAGIEPRFLLFALQHEARHILFAVKEATHGTLRLDADTLQPWPIPLPRRDEQQEIVRRVAKLFDLTAAIEERVAAACDLADRLPAAVLAKAFRGELTATPAEAT